jgi:hypothetical protein
MRNISSFSHVIDTTLSPHMDYIGYRQLLDLGSPSIIPCLGASYLFISLSCPGIGCSAKL